MAAEHLRPPGRLPSDAAARFGPWAAAAFALLLYGTLPGTTHLLFQGPHAFLRPPRWSTDLAAVVLAVPVCWAVRRPAPVLGALLAETAAVTVYGGHTWPFLFAADLLVFHLAATWDRRTAARSALATALTGALSALATRQGPFTSRLNGPWLDLLVLTALAWIAGSWLRLRQEQADARREQGEQRAVQAERARIARELHDLVAHSIGVITIQAGAGARVVDTRPAAAKEALAAIESTGRETLVGLRRMLGALREADAADAADVSGAGPAPVLADLERLAAAVRASGQDVALRRTGRVRPLSPEVELSAYRIVQEALTNTVRHSGGTRCQIRLDYGEQELSIEITDDGTGRTARAEGSGYGLAGMRERVALLHGSLTAGPDAPGGGWRVRAGLPL